MDRRYFYALFLLAVSPWLLAAGFSAVPTMWQNAGSNIGVATKVNCSTGMSCSASGSTITVTSTAGGGHTIADEGVALPTEPTLNFTGAGVSCTDSPGTTSTVCNITSGGANVVEVSINLGTSGGLIFSTTVTGQTWVGASSKITCSPFATNADGQTVETYAAAALTAQAANRVVGTGFDLWVQSPRGATGTFRFHCTGA